MKSGDDSGDASHRAAPNRFGLHLCKRYRNLVRYDPELCGRCPFRGFEEARGGS